MEALARIIGPAPHERTFPALMQFLQEERKRISDLLSQPKVAKRSKAAKVAKPRAKAKPTISEEQLRLLSQATGISVEDLRRK